MDNYGHSDQDQGGEVLDTAWEKLFSIHLYLFRKMNLFLCVGLLGVVRNVSKFFGFHFEASVSDREAWKWKPLKNVPRVHAQVKRRDQKDGSKTVTEESLRYQD